MNPEDINSIIDEISNKQFSYQQKLILKPAYQTLKQFMNTQKWVETYADKTNSAYCK